MAKSLCFVLMPFGKKPNPDGSVIDFDSVYADLIAPAVEAADLEPLRADQETTSGIIHKPMFERLFICRYAVVDLTQFNPNVFYELGVRHAARSQSTVQIIAEGARLPFDIQMLRTIHYKLTPAGAPDPSELVKAKSALTVFLIAAKKGGADSPIFQLLDGLKPSDLDQSKAQSFRERVDAAKKTKERLAIARKQSASEIRAVEQSLGDLEDEEEGVLIDLLHSYRDVKAWEEMIRLVGCLPLHLQTTVLVREQHALALNRAGKREEAARLLKELIAERGASSETYGLLGRVYKDHWEETLRTGSRFKADGLLDDAIDAYSRGFQSDWRDAYPGINAVTLMTLKDPPDDRVAQLLPMVRFAVEQKVSRGQPDYWDHATLVELGVLAKDKNSSLKSLGKALATQPFGWMAETTARNLRLIREARESRNEESVAWAAEIETELDRVSKSA
jgi:hypothetical protein